MELGFLIIVHKNPKGRKATTDFNSVMMNNLRDGIPIAVMIKQSSGGYMVCGLGFIEEYNAATEVSSSTVL